ncbi:phosphorylase family protein [Methanothrix sp.]
MTSVPDQAEIHRLCSSRIRGDRMDAAKLFYEHFSGLPDKSDAWQDLVSLAYDEDNDVRFNAVVALVSAFVQVPDKAQAGHDLHNLIQDKNGYIVFRELVSREVYTQDLIEIFCLIPNKDEAWQDLHKLTKDDSGQVRFIAAYILSDFFSLAPNKVEAWQDLRRLLIQHNDFGMMEFRAIEITARAIVKNFSYLPDKAQTWEDFVTMAENYGAGRHVRSIAVASLGSVFAHVPDKNQAWQDLVRIASFVGANGVQIMAAQALGSAFAYVSDKEQAWQDLVKLTGNEYIFVRSYAAKALGTAFIHVRDKSEAWSILHKLAYDTDDNMRSSIAYTIGSVFSYISDRDEAWEDLVNLSRDKNNVVRMNAYHSLGRVSIFKATTAKDNDTLKRKLEDAINYFDKSSHESDNSPSRFCFPFYRSYYAIAFQDAKEDEVQRYLAEAREAVGGSKSKEELLLAVENLAKALQEAQSQRDRPLEDNASDLNYYRWYCEKAAEYMATAEDDAPGAVKLMRKGNPLLDERVQANNVEIQRKARQICQITSGSGTEFKAPGAEIHQAAAGLSGDLVSIQRSSSRIVKQLKKFCMRLPEKEKDQVCKDVEEIESEADFPEKLHLIELALFNLEPILKSHQNPLVDVVILTVLPEEYNQVLAKLSSLGLPLNMATNPNIYAWRFGEAFCPIHNRAYKVAVGMIGRAGDIQSALAAKDAISQWRPNYLVFSGIAGGLPDSGLNKGDVIIADCIYGYEHGKIKEKFDPRGNWTFKTDQGLLTGATAYSLQKGWRDHIKLKPPEECEPKVVSGEIASGEKVIDDPSNEFFKQVIKQWPRVKAVEMEGAGIGSAIEQAQSLKVPVGFMVIRAISDLPRPEEEGDDARGTEERDDWKPYASDVAAAFTIGWIGDGLPLPPSTRE